MVILDGGNVGIGTSTPIAKLEVSGDFSTGRSVIIEATNATKSNGAYTLEVDSSAHTSNMTNAGALKVDVYNGTALLVNGHGDIGIGNSTPSARTHIVGSGNTSATNTLLVENSDGDDIMLLQDSKAAYFYGSANFEQGLYVKTQKNLILYSSDNTEYTRVVQVGGDLRFYQNGAGSESLNYTLKENGQLLLNTYTGTTHDGTPVKILGVDASGNVVKTTRTYQTKSSLNFNSAGEATVTLPSTALYGVTATLESSAAEFIVIAQYLAGTSVKFKLYDHTGSAVASVTRTVHYTYTI